MSADREDDDLAAAELVFGLADPETASALAARAGRDPEFAACVARWEARALPLLATLPPVQPPADAWERIRNRIAAPTDEGRMVPLSRLRRWQVTSAALALALAASVLPLVLVDRRVEEPTTAQAPPPVPAPGGVLPSLSVAQLSSPDGTPVLAAGFNTHSRRLLLRVLDLATSARVPMLWVIPRDGTPRRLGPLEHGRLDRVLTREESANLHDGATLAVSLEAANDVGRPAPAGPIVATGPMLPL